RAVYAANGAGFLELANRSLYPRAAFFDSPDHLSEPWQIVHSRAVAEALVAMGCGGQSRQTTAYDGGLSSPDDLRPDPSRHSRDGGNLGQPAPNTAPFAWIPAVAGMTRTDSAITPASIR
ncbi:MAG TPA: hypothetical protein VIJ55_14580, partial [Acetobacteraceae bacterium]